MSEITQDDYLQFIKEHDFVIVENVKIKLKKKWNIKNFSPPEEYHLEKNTVWSFPDRGKWATHIGDYRGNWSPYIPRNLILKYSQKGDWVLDQMMGSGTTLVEAKLLQRNAIGVDINLNSVMLARDRLNFTYNPLLEDYKEPIIKTYHGDARNLNKIKDESIDLIVTHPPYANIISYSKKEKISDDLSQLSLEKYLQEMKKVAKESFRVLKPGKICAILIGDTRKHKHYIPISYRVMEIFLEEGFILKEDIIKIQWNMKTTREKWIFKENDFYLITHEHIFVFRKPLDEKDYKKFKFSIKW
ncbi:MAG: methyltransferase domain-containing protein [Candidatus Omnitrophica bacterium]|nr:methyltransferase domain-containing protein [Candidatus Omnitrophota bacterium]